MRLKKVEDCFNKVSYTARRKKRLSEYESKYQEYMKMNEVEFIMDYTKATTKYLENQTTFGFSWISTMVALVATLYGYIVSVKAGIENANFAGTETEIVLRVSITVGVLILLTAILFLIALSRHRYEIIREKVFMEEMKELRAKKLDSEH